MSLQRLVPADAAALVRASFSRPYRVTVRMVVLVSLVPLYVFIPLLFPAATRYAPELPLDRAIPVVPVWALVYGALYLFLIVLPVLLVRQEDELRRLVNAYLTAWIVAYVFFVAYPTVLPRPEVVPGDGFAGWGLRALYDADAPYNCFPSLHVAHSFVSALACLRVHRRVGELAIGCAAVVAVSTLFAKQHYVADVLAGVVLALVAWAVFIRGRSLKPIPESDRRVAPVFATGLLVTIGGVVAVMWSVHALVR